MFQDHSLEVGDLSGLEEVDFVVFGFCRHVFDEERNDSCEIGYSALHFLATIKEINYKHLTK